jgi:hypothetical protein
MTISVSQMKENNVAIWMCGDHMAGNQALIMFPNRFPWMTLR